ncbi:MAG: tetratricopeptide repeat protein [Acidobacteria bacterium]|nr:tetratricopeptide repeat protein [Acidobacteriota bacterium]
MKLFHARDFTGAVRIFEQAANGPSREVAHVARQHVRMCQQRLAKMIPALKGPEDYYNYGVSLINRRQLSTAEETLKRALEQAPNADHVYYALSICRGLQGDLDQAAKFLEQAIRLDPKNRMIARNDPDLLEFGRRSPVRELVFAEKKESA